MNTRDHIPQPLEFVFKSSGISGRSARPRCRRHHLQPDKSATRPKKLGSYIIAITTITAIIDSTTTTTPILFPILLPLLLLPPYNYYCCYWHLQCQMYVRCGSEHPPSLEKCMNDMRPMPANLFACLHIHKKYMSYVCAST